MSGTHYYHPESLELIDGDLRQARKVGGLPSPTTVLRILSSEGLKRYFKRQMWEATCTTPRLPEMNDEDHWEACLRWANEHGGSARERGGDFHTLCQQFHMAKLNGGTYHLIEPFSLQPQFAAYENWYDKNIHRTLLVEEPVLGQGYAGRLDHLAQLRNQMLAIPPEACLDVKTQERKKDRFNFYPEWAVQLGAYAGALPTMPDVLVSVVVSSNEPVVVEAYEWPKPPAYYHKIFLGLLEYWKFAHNYYAESP